MNINGGHDLTVRHSSLDIFASIDRRSPETPTVVRVNVEAGNRVQRCERHAQSEPCDPLVTTAGESYRMKEARQKGGRTAEPSV